MARKLRGQGQILSGSPSGQFTNFSPKHIQSTRAPTTADTGYEICQMWADTSSGIIYGLASVSAGSATWNLLGPGSSDVDSLAGDSGTDPVVPSGGKITLTGGTNISTVGGTNEITLNLDAAISLATSVTSPIYTTSAADMNINSAAGQDIIMQMGDAIAGNKISFEDSASAEVASLDSDGTLTVVNMDGIIGSSTPAAGTFTTVTGNTSVTSPIYTVAAAADLNINSASGQDIIIKMGDNAAANKVSFTDSDDMEVAAIDSNGGFTMGSITFTGLLTASASATIETAGTALNLGSDNSGDAVNLGVGNIARAISIGTTAATAHTVAIGNTAAGAVTVDSGAGIDITSAEAASSDGVNIVASAADGGITLDAGSGGILIGISADCTPISLGDVVPTSARTITVGGGTVATAIADTIDIGPDGADTDAGASKVVNVNTGGVTLGTLTTNIGSGAVTSGAHTVNIQSGNAAAGTVATNISTGTGTKTVNVGNADANTTFNVDAVTLINDSVNAATSINTGTSTGSITIGNSAAGAIALDTDAGFSINGDDASTISVTAGTLDIDSSGDLSINSSAGVINVGNDAVAQDMNIGTGAAARTITVGNTSGASSVVVDVGTGAASFGASATAHTTTIGSTTGAAATVIQAGTGEITVTGTVKEIGAEFLEASGDEITSVSQNPILQAIADTGAAPVGTIDTANIMYLQQGVAMESYNVSAQTIIAPRMDANGLNIALDQAVGEGVEYNWGAGRTNSRHAFTIGTDAAFFFEIGLYINDMDGAAPYVIGFRKSEANNATFGNYTDYATIGMIAASSTTNIVTATELNSGGQTVTDTTDAWGGDGSTNTLRVLVDASGNVTYTINGSAPSASVAFQFDNADVVCPFIRVEHSASATDVAITSLKVGYQA